MLLLYFGPEILMPAASAVAAILGSILMFGRRMLSAVRSAARRVGSVFRSRSER